MAISPKTDRCAFVRDSQNLRGSRGGGGGGRYEGTTQSHLIYGMHRKGYTAVLLLYVYCVSLTLHSNNLIPNRMSFRSRSRFLSYEFILISIIRFSLLLLPSSILCICFFGVFCSLDSHSMFFNSISHLTFIFCWWLLVGSLCRAHPLEKRVYRLNQICNTNRKKNHPFGIQRYTNQL